MLSFFITLHIYLSDVSNLLDLTTYCLTLAAIITSYESKEEISGSFRLSSNLTKSIKAIIMKHEEDMTKGVLYYAQGAKYLREAEASAKSLKRHNPQILVCLKTTDKGYSSKFFDNIDVIEPLDHHFKTKVLALSQSPFDLTLFLDSDTKVLKPVPELFDFLHTYDMGVAYLPLCEWPAGAPPVFLDYVDLSKYNTGVILYKGNDKVKQFMKQWLETACSHAMGPQPDGEHLDDQIDFNYLVIQEKVHIPLGISIVNLPGKIYNARPWFWEHLKKKREWEHVKILHAHGLDRPWLKDKFIKLQHMLYQKRIIRKGLSH
jgi:hypothetical protein